MSEHAAYHRIEAARAARRFPVILELVTDGSVTLTTVAMLRPHLTDENHEALLAAARHKTKREVEHQVACLAPRPDAPVLIRRLPAQKATEAQATELLQSGVASQAPSSKDSPRAPAISPPEPRPRIAPLATNRYLCRVTLTAVAHANLRRVQQLLAHSVPGGNPAVIIDRALALLVAKLERAKIAAVRRARIVSSARTSPSAAGSRHIPAEIRLWTSDTIRQFYLGAPSAAYQSRQP